MTIAYNWQITETNYQTSDKFIFQAHWTCVGVDGDYSASIINTASWQAGTPTIPYANVTQQDVLNWIWESGVDKDAAEASIAQQIELQKNPVQASGLPWAQA